MQVRYERRIGENLGERDRIGLGTGILCASICAKKVWAEVIIRNPSKRNRCAGGLNLLGARTDVCSCSGNPSARITATRIREFEAVRAMKVLAGDDCTLIV
jgi:hypothetical protein